jgi:hypothetical protein
MVNLKRHMNRSLYVAAVLLGSAMGPAFAEGGSGFSTFMSAGQAPGAGSSSQDVAVGTSAQGDRYTYNGGAEAGAYAQSGPAGNSASVNVGSYGAAGGSTVTVQNSETATSFVKGSNVIAKGQSVTQTRIYIGGNQYVVADEVAIAVARSSQFGATAAAGVETGIGTVGGSSGGQVAAGKGASR